MDIRFSLFGYRYDFWALGVLAQPSYNANTDFPKNFMKSCLSNSIFACMRYFKLKLRCYSVKASHIHFHFELYCFYIYEDDLNDSHVTMATEFLLYLGFNLTVHLLQ